MSSSSSSSNNNNSNATGNRREQHADRLAFSAMREHLRRIEMDLLFVQAENAAMKTQLEGLSAAMANQVVQQAPETSVLQQHPNKKDVQIVINNIIERHGLMVRGGGGYDYNEEFRRTHNEEVTSIIMAYCRGSTAGCVLDNKELCKQICKCVIQKLHSRQKIQRLNAESLNEHFGGGEALLRMECMSPEVSDDDLTSVLWKQKPSFHNAEVDDYFQMLDTLESRGKKGKEGESA
ncbi:hypothetical protein BDA99DRAFT_566507 [Phascolomyces articulosus]|uniref:Uncharacterized protein n=1 Tax=Phascolomyces articulosus TaxID=60185 RepID=A0AAD5P8H3_9FUNG|nr:hypothetical protein BDA99DRAFT_566507 [Phascolomyces articulosus]